MREDAGFAHAGDFGQCADRQTLQADLRSQSERCVNDGGFRLLPLEQNTFRRFDCKAGVPWMKGYLANGHEQWIKKNDRSIFAWFVFLQRIPVAL